MSRKAPLKLRPILKNRSGNASVQQDVPSTSAGTGTSCSAFAQVPPRTTAIPGSSALADADNDAFLGAELPTLQTPLDSAISSKSRSTQQRPHSHVILAFAAVLCSFSIVLATLVLIIVYIAATQPKVRATCDTSDCENHVSALGLSRVHAEDPCEDFGRFVCSGWTLKYKGATRTVVQEVLVDWFHRVADLALSNTTGGAISNEAHKMMVACVTRPEDYTASLKGLKSFMAARGLAWPENDLHVGPEDYAKLLRLLIDLDVNWALPFWFHIERQHSGSEKGRAFVLRPSSMVSFLWHFNRKLQNHRGAYDWYVELFELFVFRDDISVPSAFHSFLKNSAGVQMNISEALGSVDKSGVYRPQLIRLGSKPTTATKLTPVMWMDALREVYGNELPVTVSDVLLATKERLIAVIENLFVTFSAETLWFHTTWWFLQDVGTFSSSVLPAIIATINFGKLGRALNDVYCVVQAELTYSALLAAITMSQFTKDEVREIPGYFGRIKTTAIEKMASSERMNDSMKVKLLNVLRETAIALWPEGDLLSQGSFDELYGAADNVSSDFFSLWHHARLALQKSRGSSLYEEATKTCRVNKNRLFLYKIIPNIFSASVASLRPPLYYASGTSAMTYGGIAFFFARELVDALSFMILRPRRNESTWGTNTPRQVWHEVSCPAPEDRALVFPTLPALDIAYSAYKRYRNPTKDLPLRGLDSYTPEQIFFLTFCHATCRIEEPTGVQFSPDCTMAVRNFEPFAKAFSCKPGTRMHPVNRCHYF
ncbi:membrane metallo-endopeptidase-like 1 [Rhipicephalus microplus]|uniref:membrane metallo-endopeptidase-like 1 n=1 Tax=Rhipicephalus microplus TaxID=6941 RepID=UPI003F6ADBA2